MVGEQYPCPAHTPNRGRLCIDRLHLLAFILFVRFAMKESKFDLSLHKRLNFSGVTIHIIKVCMEMNLSLKNKLYVE